MEVAGQDRARRPKPLAPPLAVGDEGDDGDDEAVCNAKNLPGGSTLAYNSSQEATGLAPASGTATTYGYNTAGERTSATTGTAKTSYAFNPYGDLTSATLPSKTVTYTVDGDDLRQSRTSGSTTTKFLWDTQANLPILLDDGTHTYIYGPNATPIAQVDTSGTFTYLHSDLLGTPRLITSATGAVAGARAYTAYGTVTGSSGTTTSGIGFTGNWTDTDTGFVYLRARDYDPTTGQFVSRDPAIDTTHQPYAYAHNAPASVTDPTGLCGSTPTPWVHCAELSPWDQFFTSGPADALGDALTHGPTGEVSNFLQGIGNGATFGLTGQLRDALVPNYACQADNDIFYGAGSVAGGVALGIVTAGTGTEVEAGARVSTTPRFLSSLADKLSEAARGLLAKARAVDDTGAMAIGRYDDDQAALVSLAKEARRTGGVSREYADTLVEWANEYLVPSHRPMVHPLLGGREPSGFGQTVEHINIGPVRHIPIR